MAPGSQPALPHREGVGTSRLDDDDHAAIRAQLHRLLESPIFHSSKRSSLFLQFIVEHSLSAPDEPLKERVLGVQVFGREPNYDTAADPVVRTTAGEIRRRLGQYYADPAHQHELRVELSARGYTPMYLWPTVEDAPRALSVATAMSAPAIEPAAAREPAPTRRAGRMPVLSSRALAVMAGIAVALLLGVTLMWMLTLPVTHRDASFESFERFWAPLIESRVPVLVCIGSNQVYDLSARLIAAIDAAPRNADAGTPLAVQRDELRRVGTPFVSLSDALALARLASFLQEHHTPYQVRENHAASFADLRASPSLLIGMFSNAWTLELGSDFRFLPTVDATRGQVLIRDRQHPNQNEWSVAHPWPALNVTRDYALVSRVRDPVTGNFVMIGAGITPYGTTAAVELLTSPQYLQQALHDAPPDWPNRNLQIVLETRVLHAMAGPPHVLAAHFW
jgi:hypothetical protein